LPFFTINDRRFRAGGKKTSPEVKKDIMKRIKNNDLTHYFLSDHRQLPASYLASCQKFFKSLSCKPQAPSSPGHKLQASSLTAAGPCVNNRIIKDKL